MTAWRQNVTFQRYQLKNALHNGCSAESFFPLCPFFRVRARDGKERKVANKAPFTAAARRHLRSRAGRVARAAAAAASSAARPQRRLSLSLEPEAAEHDRVRGRQAEGKDEQRPFVCTTYYAFGTARLSLDVAASLLTVVAQYYQPALSSWAGRRRSSPYVLTYTYYYIVAKAAMAAAKPCNERCRRPRLPWAAVHNDPSKAAGSTVVRGAQGGVH